MSHLKDNNVSYFKHMGMAWTLAKFGFKIAFYGMVHAIFPERVSTLKAGETVEKAHLKLVEMRLKNNINFYEE